MTLDQKTGRRDVSNEACERSRVRTLQQKNKGKATEVEIHLACSKNSQEPGWNPGAGRNKGRVVGDAFGETMSDFGNSS